MVKPKACFICLFIFLIVFFVALTVLNLMVFNTVQVFQQWPWKEMSTATRSAKTTNDRHQCVNKCQDCSKTFEKTLRDKEWQFVERLMQKETKSKRLPTIIGIGVEKCGTHAFTQFLSEHPMIRSRTPFEAHFFDNRNYKPGQEQDYIRSMPDAGDNAFIMEKTPAYFSFPPGILPNRIKSTSGSSKLVLVLCDPTKRVISDYVQEIIMKTIKKEDYPTVESYLEVYLDKYRKYTVWRDEKEMTDHRDEILLQHYKDYPSTILTTGLYALHLSRWYEHYNSSNLHIINGDEMLHHPGRVMEKVQEFLGIPKLLLREDYVLDPKTQTYCFLHPVTKKTSCIGSYKMRTRNGKMKIDENTLKLIRDFYRVPNELLYKLVNTRFDW